jgi:C4-type Zn-finger protein
MSFQESKRCPYCQSWAMHWQKVEHSISHWPHILVVHTEGWMCKSCHQTSFDPDVTQFFEKMANKLRVGDIDGLTSLGGDYFSTSYRSARSLHHPLGGRKP